jgi:hypothetical protein
MTPRKCGSEIRLRRVRLRPRHELGQRLRRHLRPDRQPEIERADLRHRGKIRDRIVVERRIDVLIDRHRRDRSQQKRRSVCCRVLYGDDTDAPGTAGAVLHDDRPVQRNAQLLADQPRKRVARSAGSEREHDADRLLHELCLRWRGKDRERDGNERAANLADATHISPPNRTPPGNGPHQWCPLR